MDVSSEILEDSKKKDNCLTSKSFPNYILLIFLFIIIILITVIIVISSSSSNKKSDNIDNSNTNTNDKIDDKTDYKTDDKTDDTTDDKTPSEVELTPWEKYIKAEKYLYIWEYYTPEYILKLCQDHNFSRVYLSIGCIEQFWDGYYSNGKFPAEWEIGSLDYETFIKQLNAINVEVELVTFLGSNANDFTEIDRAVKVANMVKDL
jgi:hypothetical protein